MSRIWLLPAVLRDSPISRRHPLKKAPLGSIMEIVLLYLLIVFTLPLILQLCCVHLESTYNCFYSRINQSTSMFLGFPQTIANELSPLHIQLPTLKTFFGQWMHHWALCNRRWWFLYVAQCCFHSSCFYCQMLLSALAKV